MSQVRLEAVQRVRQAYDVELPRLRSWNYEPCGREVWDFVEGRHVLHDHLRPDCYQCGVEFRRHQRVGVSWLYLAKRALLADVVGTGKTIHAAGLMGLCLDRGELGGRQRAVVIMRPAALLQWRRQLRRTLPGLHVLVTSGEETQGARLDRYLGETWDVLLVGHQLLLKDIEAIEAFRPSMVVVDDVDPLRHKETKTAWAIKRLAREAQRVVVMSATPLQKTLEEMHSVLEPVGGYEVFGSATVFQQRYTNSELTRVYIRRTGRTITKRVVTGYKNVDEFVRLMSPMCLRRTADDIDDVALPDISTNEVWLDLYPSQRAKYKELQKGIYRVMKSGVEHVKRTAAGAAVSYGARVCTGLASLGEDDLPNTSCKLDWLMGELAGDLAGEKVVVFCAFRDSVRALAARLTAAGIGHVLYWGEDRRASVRDADITRFREDPNCNVLVGTQAIEQSLDLQVSRHLVNLDLIMNPQRMVQLAGRIRRDGSRHRTVYVHNVLTRDTQEERYLPSLEREAALASYVWGETSELFAPLNPLQLLQLIAP